MVNWQESFVSAFSRERATLSVLFQPSVSFLFVFFSFLFLLVSGRIGTLGVPSPLRETVALLLIHLSSHCSPNQSPMEASRALPSRGLPNCGCPGNASYNFSIYLFIYLLWCQHRCVAAAVWTCNRTGPCWAIMSWTPLSWRRLFVSVSGGQRVAGSQLARSVSARRWVGWFWTSTQYATKTHSSLRL